MPTYREEDVKELSLEDKRAACLHCWGRDFGNCDKCALKGINRRTYKELERQLAASEEARKKAEAKRDEYLHITAECRDAAGDWREHPEAMGDPYEVPAVISRLKQRAEAAEQRIKASQEQEPAFVIHDELGNTHNLYKQPPIPPELSEVVRERDELRKKLEKYER